MRLILLLVTITTITISAQDTNKVVVDERSGKPMLEGYVTREVFNDTSFSWWYNSEYEMYEPDTSSISEIRDKLLESDILIVIGTWCSDSRRELPRFLKILDFAAYPEEKIKMISVDRTKKAEGTDLQALNIEYIPTFIFYLKGEETGRIVEAPGESLEKDLRLIFR